MMGSTASGEGRAAVGSVFTDALRSTRVEGLPTPKSAPRELVLGKREVVSMSNVCVICHEKK